MVSNRKFVQIFGCLAVLLFSTCRATTDPTVNELILDSLKNIEDLIREMSQPTAYLTSTVGQNGIVHSPQLLHSRDNALNDETYEDEELREHLQRHPQRPRSAYWLPPPLSSNENFNLNNNDNELHEQTEDDMMPIQLGPGHLRMKTNPRYNGARPFSHYYGYGRGQSASSSNANSKFHTNSHSNSGHDRRPAHSNIPSNSGTHSGRHHAMGARSLSRGRNANRNVNTNVNTNSNSNILDNEDIDYDIE